MQLKNRKGQILLNFERGYRRLLCKKRAEEGFVMEYMKKLEFLWGMPVFWKEKGKEELKSFGNYMEEESPFLHSRTLVELLIQKTDAQKLPVLYQDAHALYFVCVRTKKGYFFTGPVCMEELNFIQLNQYIRAYQIPDTLKKKPKKSTVMRLLNFAGLLYELGENKTVTVEEIWDANGLALSTDRLMVDRENTKIDMRRIDEDISHHTYQEERYVMDCIREGNTGEILERMDALMEHSGILSGKQVNHQKNLAIVSIAMATREAISGGVSPTEAYRLSDIFINYIDKSTSREELLEYNRKSVYEFTRLVAETKRKKRNSSYTEQCKDFIHKNYNKKISLEQVAKQLGISQSHLSRCFKEDMGMSIQDYLLHFRVERAANLLRYSEASLSEISDYVCFYSQSHFGSVFKKYMHMTPKQYRNRYKEKEFRS